ncbi:hypothetical protein [Actinoplanes sp. NBRC 101535]|uniref:hypothetical protein n=1 Tax=Actinoplanes sp. NBRC 101535 TaxID=3032196 RepID=UPI0025546E6C|nr:hypothetical protein [Actinoplanes sp. NBRC 101535]
MHRDQAARMLAAVTLTLSATGCTGIGSAGRPDQGGPLGGWRTAGCEFRRAPQYTVVGGIRLPTTPARLGATVDRIDKGGRERFGASFAGVEVDEMRVRAILYRVPSAGFDDFVRTNAEDSCIVVRDAAHGVGELGHWNDRVVADLAYWSDRGVRIVTVGSRNDGAGVEIGTHDLARARRELPARYGRSAPLVFVAENPDGHATPAGDRAAIPETGG